MNVYEWMALIGLLGILVGFVVGRFSSSSFGDGGFGAAVTEIQTLLADIQRGTKQIRESLATNENILSKYTEIAIGVAGVPDNVCDKLEQRLGPAMVKCARCGGVGEVEGESPLMASLREALKAKK